MQVAHFLSSTAFHGAEAMTAELIRQLSALGIDNHLLLLDNDGRADRQIIAATHGHVRSVEWVPCRGALDVATFRHTARWVRSTGIDVIHSHKYKTTFYGLPSRLAFGVGLVTTYHNWITTSPALRFYAALDKRLARFNDAAVAVSSPVTRILRSHMPEQRCHQIDNGIDTGKFVPAGDRRLLRQELGLPAHGLVLGCVGRLSSEKGIGRLIDALAGVHGESDWTLVLIGDGNQRAALEAQAEAAGLARRIRFVGHQHDTRRWYQAMDLYLLPSHVEAFPMALLEAMASGCAVLAADVGEVARILDNGRCGRLIAGDAALPWTAALQEMLSRPGELALQARSARERVVEFYSAATMAARYLAVYETAQSRRQLQPA